MIETIQIAGPAVIPIAIAAISAVGSTVATVLNKPKAAKETPIPQDQANADQKAQLETADKQAAQAIQVADRSAATFRSNNPSFKL